LSAGRTKGIAELPNCGTAELKNGKQNSKSCQRGYTLMEMMVVLALIAIAAALVVPSIAHGYGSFELRLTASSLSSAFKQARMHAVYEARNYVVLIGAEENNRRDVYVVREDGKTVDHITLPGNLRLVAEQQRDVWTQELRPIHFFADGHSEALQIDVSNPNGHHLQLVLNPLTARAQVTQLYSSDEKPVPLPAVEESAPSVSVITGGRQ
jgi:type II secretion system protein H